MWQISGLINSKRIRVLCLLNFSFERERERERAKNIVIMEVITPPYFSISPSSFFLIYLFQIFTYLIPLFFIWVSIFFLEKKKIWQNKRMMVNFFEERMMVNLVHIYFQIEKILPVGHYIRKSIYSPYILSSNLVNVK